MRLFFILLTGFFLFGSTHLNAQAPNERCAHTSYEEYLETVFPGFSAANERTFQEAKQRGEASAARGGSDVYTINLVIHIVHVTSNPAQNLADSIIENQVEVLNADFRRMNEDANNLRPEFDGIVGDPLIQFDLLEVRRVGINSFIFPGFNLYDDIKSTAAGGSDPVDPSTTLNIWVGELFPGLVLGYAYPPADLCNWPAGSSAPSAGVDGVVIDYRAFGANNPASSFYENQGAEINGRTTVHEVGHYLGLRHIWGDGACEEDDGIEDTPEMAENSQATGCSPTKNTCGAGTNGDLPDMWENYMDYSQETCQVAFTKGQINVMRGILEGPRSGIVQETVSCSSPVTGVVQGLNAADELTTQNYRVPLTCSDFEWSVNNGTINSGNGTNEISVTWGNAGEGRVCVTESSGVCTGDEECLTVALSVACTNPTTGSISGEISVLQGSSESYSIPASGNDYSWSVTGGTIASGDGTNTIDVTWGNGTAGEVCVTESDGACTGNEECTTVTLTVASGMEELALRRGLNIFPNPATEFSRVSANAVPLQIEVVNVLGEVLMTYYPKSETQDIDLSGVSDQTVFVRVRFEEGEVVRSLLIR